MAPQPKLVLGGGASSGNAGASDLALQGHWKRFLALLGVFAMGEGLTLILIPRDYMRFWAGNVSELIGKVKPNLLARPQMIRLLGVVELGIGMGCVAMRLVNREKPAVPVD